jgi:hypothetical protein
MELRCLMSSRNSSENFDLRCLVREEMTAWIRQNYPNAFPTARFAATAEVPVEMRQPGNVPPS